MTKEVLKAEVKPSCRLSDFEVIEILGAGSFGTVYKVRHTQTNGVFAMKALKKRNLIIRKQYNI